MQRTDNYCCTHGKAEPGFLPNPNILTLKAFNNLQAHFKTINHRPSEEMLMGLFNLQDTLTRMVSGDLQNKYYISALDCGVGKTTAIMKWLNVYLPIREVYGDLGVIICFDRVEEIKRFADDNSLPDDCFSVLISEKSNDKFQLLGRGLGVENSQKAPVLLTTKAQILQRTLGGRSFESVNEFHYCNEPRAIRVWDESMITGRELLISDFQVMELINTINRTDPVLAQTVKQFCFELAACKDKAIITVPDFGGIDLRYAFRWWKTEMRETAETLSILSGKVATVRTDGKGRLALDCTESIPDDFKPCLVTDASARIRETYRLQEEYRKDVIRLEPAHSCKTYENHTVHIWNKASGKDSYRKHGVDEVAQEVVKVIKKTPGEFLVVVFLELKGKMEKAVLNGLPPADHYRVKFLHWGLHTATNEYCKIPNVILTSTLYYRPADYEVGARAASGLTTLDGTFSEERLKAYRNGETAHHILQCICRGLVRRSNGSGCYESNSWIITPKAMKVEELLPEIFPQCVIKPWEVASVKVKPLVQRMGEYIKGRLTETESLPSSEVRKHFGICDQSTFKRDYLIKASFKSYLDDLGIVLNLAGKRPYFELNPFLQR